MRLIRNKNGGPGGATSQYPPSAASAAAAEALRVDSSACVSSGSSRSSIEPQNSPSSMGRTSSTSLNDQRRGFENNAGSISGGTFRWLGRRFIFKSSSQATTSEHSTYLHEEGRSRSYSSESTTYSSPPRTPTTPPRLSASKDGHGFRYTNAIPQLPPLGSFSAVGEDVPTTLKTDSGAWSNLLAADYQEQGIIPTNSRMTSKCSNIAVPTPTRTSTNMEHLSLKLTLAPLPKSTSPVRSPKKVTVVDSDLASKEGRQDSASQPLTTSGSVFDESSDFLQAMLSLADSGSNCGLFDEPATASSPQTSHSPSTGTLAASLDLCSFDTKATGGLPRRMTEAQLNELAEKERQSKAQAKSQRSVRPKPTVSPGLFAARSATDDSGESSDEYGEAEQEPSDDHVDAAYGSNIAARTESAPSAGPTGGGSIVSVAGNKIACYLKSNFNSTSSALKIPTASTILARSPNPSDGDAAVPSGAFLSSFSLGKKNRSPSPSLKSPTSPGPLQNQVMGPATTETTPITNDNSCLPGLTSPAKRALYACTLLKVHPQLESLLKVDSSASGRIAASSPVEIRYPRSINSTARLQLASRVGGNQTGVAGAPITLCARRLDVALGQTKVMRKLRQRLPLSEEVEIGWFLRNYASELVSPEMIFRSLAAKPQVSPEALAKSPAANIDLTTRDGPENQLAHSEGTTTPPAARAITNVPAAPVNGLALWISRRPFLERCSMIRGDFESSLKVGDVLLDHATKAVVPVASSDTFQVGRANFSRLSAKPDVISVRPGDIVLSSRARILAGLSPKPFSPSPPVAETRPEISAIGKTPPPWIAPRHRARAQPAQAIAPACVSSNDHIKAAHDKLTSRSAENRSVREEDLIAAQAVPLDACCGAEMPRASRADGRSRFAMIESDEDASAETSGSDFFSADEGETQDKDIDDDDVPIAALARVGSHGSSTALAPSAVPSNDGIRTLGKTPSAPDHSVQSDSHRIAQLETELEALRTREREREARIAVERLQLARLQAQHRKAIELKEQKRQLKAARERRSRTDHSDVLQDKSYGAGDASLFAHHSRRLRQSISMKDVTSASSGVAPSWQPVEPTVSARRISQHQLGATCQSINASSPRSPKLRHLPDSHTLSPFHSLSAGDNEHAPMLTSTWANSAYLQCVPDLSATVARLIHPNSATLASKKSGVHLLPPSATDGFPYSIRQAKATASCRNSVQPRSSLQLQSAKPGLSSPMLDMPASHTAAALASLVASPSRNAKRSPRLSSMASQPNLLGHRSSMMSLSSIQHDPHLNRSMAAS